MNLPPYLRAVVETPATYEDEKERLAIALSQGLPISKAAEIAEIPRTLALQLSSDYNLQEKVARLKQERLARGELVAQDLITVLSDIIHDDNVKTADKIAAVNSAKALFPEFDTRLRVDATIDKVERVYIGIDVSEV